MAELPDNPNDLINESYNRYSIMDAEGKESHLPHALQDEDDYETVDDWTNFY